MCFLAAKTQPYKSILKISDRHYISHKSFQNIPECSRMLKVKFKLKISDRHYISHKLFQNVPESLSVLKLKISDRHYISHKSFQNVPEGSRMFQNVPEYTQMSLHADCRSMSLHASP